MKKTVVIHQPDFLPYLGFFHRLLNANLYVVLDQVQFVRWSSRSWNCRDKIKTPRGEKWITLSVQKSPRDTRIMDVMLSHNVDWRSEHLTQIKLNYGKAMFYNEIIPYIEKLYSFQCEKMMDFNLKSIKMLMELFDIRIDTVFASDIHSQSKSNELLVDILKKVGATTYLSGVGAKDYYEPGPFEEAGIEVIWQNFEHPVYPQLHGEFIPYLSSIDLLFNCGIMKSREILRSV